MAAGKCELAFSFARRLLISARSPCVSNGGTLGSVHILDSLASAEYVHPGQGLSASDGPTEVARVGLSKFDYLSLYRTRSLAKESASLINILHEHAGRAAALHGGRLEVIVDESCELANGHQTNGSKLLLPLHAHALQNAHG